MKFIVAVKQVPDTTKIEIDANGSLIRTGVPSILDPYCEYCLDLVRRIRKDGDTVIAVAMGPDQAKEALLRCLEMGADEAYLLSDRAFAGADTYATARTLHMFITKVCPDYDLIFCGEQAADGNTAQVPGELARMMCVQQFYYTKDIVSKGDHFEVTQDYRDEERVCVAQPPSLISVSEGDINRYVPSISQHIKAKDKEIRVLNRIDLGLGMYSVGLKGSRTKIVSSRTPDVGSECETIDGSDPSKAADRIMEVF
ncbi:MAG: electron transfer flavoprotein subunit beta/FixA family protein [Candidatus Methanomethylophilaceae archaeon]|jgi:electron transfer flavoprotein beta subunit